MSENNGREVIEAGRRRKDSTPAGRTEAPKRRRSDTGADTESPLELKGTQIAAGGRSGCWLVLLLLLAGIYFLLSIGGDSGSDLDAAQAPSQLPAQPLPATLGLTPATSAEDQQTWLVMLYLDADDPILEEDILFDLNEAERVGSSEYVHVVAQIDRYRSGFNGDGDWTSAYRYYLTRDDDLNSLHSMRISDIGEVDMADGNSLVDFVAWAVSSIPADRYVLILSDHGMGWPGGWSDPDPGVNPPSEVPLVARLGANIYLMELDESLEAARQAAGIEKFDLIGLDACLMGQMEVLAALQPHTRYAVVSEEVEPSLGWAYAAFLQGLTANAGMSAEDLSKLIVGSYIRQDLRLVDPQAREAYLRGGSVLGPVLERSGGGVDQLAQKLEYNATLSAIDLTYFPLLLQKFDAFVYALQSEDQSRVAQARTYSQSYTSIFGSQVPPAYIDLGNFAAVLARSTADNRLKQTATDLVAAVDQVVVADVHGAGVPGSSGISIYFPNSPLYSASITGAQSYTAVASRFASATLWDDFLGFHYHDLPFEPQDALRVVPQVGFPLRIPGQGSVLVSSLTSSPAVIRSGQTTRLSADISGQNIAYIYLFVGFYDRNANSINVLDVDFLESPESQQVEGVHMPVWDQDRPFTLAFNWKPVVFSISDGDTIEPALFDPLDYGVSPEQAMYAVDGTYTFSQSGEHVAARLWFQDGTMTAVYGYAGSQVAAAPHEITPRVGDRFTLQERWLDLDSTGKVLGVINQPGKTLTFGEAPFSWGSLEAPQGEYLLGFLVEDLDGNTFPVFTQVFVQ